MPTESSHAPVSEQPTVAPVVAEAPPLMPPAPARAPIKKRVILGGLGLLAIVASGFGYRWWQFARTHQQTDDAYITADIHPVNARIAGTVTAVAVADNQMVVAVYFPQVESCSEV